MAIIHGTKGPGYSETIVGTPGPDEIYPLGGNDVVDGGRGFDRVHVEAKSTEFRITTVNGVTYLDATSGASSGQGVTLRNVESVAFTDKTISLVVHDRYIDTPGADFPDGGPGTDTFVLSAPRAGFAVSANYAAATTLIKSKEGSPAEDFITNFERLEFSAGQRIALDLGAGDPAGQAVLLIGAVLGKSILPLKEELMGTAIGLFDEGYTLAQLAGAVLRLPIWAGTLTLTNSHEDIARYLLKTVYRSEPSAAAVADGAAALAAETGAAQGTWLAALAASAANQVQVDLVGLQSTGFHYSVAAGG